MKKMVFFIVFFLASAQTLFCVDIEDDRSQFMEVIREQTETFEDIEDVFFDVELSEEELNKILTEAPKPVVDEKKEAQRKQQLAEQQRLAKLQEIEALRVQKEEERLAKQKEEEALAKQAEKQRLALEKQRQEELARKEEELKTRQAQLAAEKERLAKEAAARKAEDEKKEAQRKKEKIQLASIQKEKPEAPVQKEAIQRQITTKAAPRKKVTLKELQQKLGLIDKQVQRLTPIMKEKANKRRELLRKYAGKGEAAKPALKQELLLFQNYYDDMYAHIFNEEQWVKYTAMREEQKKQVVR